MAARKGIRKRAYQSNKVFNATSSGFGLLRAFTSQLFGRLAKLGQSIEVLGKPENLAELVHVNGAIEIFDTGGKVLAKAVAAQLIHSLRMQASRRRIIRDGKRGAALVLAAPPSLSAGIAL